MCICIQIYTVRHPTIHKPLYMYACIMCTHMFYMCTYIHVCIDIYSSVHIYASCTCLHIQGLKLSAGCSAWGDPNPNKKHSMQLLLIFNTLHGSRKGSGVQFQLLRYVTEPRKVCKIKAQTSKTSQKGHHYIYIYIQVGGPSIGLIRLDAA